MSEAEVEASSAEEPAAPSKRALVRDPSRPLAWALAGVHWLLGGVTLVAFLLGLVSLTVFGFALAPPWLDSLPMTRWSIPLSLIVGVPLMAEFAHALLTRWRSRTYGRARLSRRGLLIERGYPTKVVTIPYDQLEIVEAAPRGIQLATQENAYKAWSRPLFVPTDSPAEQEELLARLEHAKLGELGDLPALPRYKEIPEQYPRPLPLRILGAAGLQLVVFFGTPLVYSHPIAYFLVVMSVLLQFVLCWLPWWRRTTQPYHALLIHDYLMHHRWEWPLAEVTALRRTGGWALLHYEADQPPLRLWLGTGPKAGSALRAALPHLPCQEGGPYEEGWDNVGEEGRYLVWSWVAVAVVVASSWLWGPALLG